MWASKQKLGFVHNCIMLRKREKEIENEIVSLCDIVHATIKRHSGSDTSLQDFSFDASFTLFRSKIGFS